MPVFSFHRRHHAGDVQIERSRCTETSADAEHLYSITYTPLPTGANMLSPWVRHPLGLVFQTISNPTGVALSIRQRDVQLEALGMIGESA